MSDGDGEGHTMLSMSQVALIAQLRWCELKMWILYYRLRRAERSEWSKLLSLESRLACTWYFQFDCMVMQSLRLGRRVLTEFRGKRQKTTVELRQMAHVLCN